MSESDPVAASETPETDAQVVESFIADGGEPYVHHTDYWAMTQHARSLERRLTAAPTEMTRLNNAHFAEQWNRLTAILGDERRSVMDTVSEVERRLTQAGRAELPYVIGYGAFAHGAPYSSPMCAFDVPDPAIAYAKDCAKQNAAHFFYFVTERETGNVLYDSRTAPAAPAVAPASGGEREAALEEAAKVCDGRVARYSQPHMRGSGADYNDGRRHEAATCAAHIRVLRAAGKDAKP